MMDQEEQIDMDKNYDISEVMTASSIEEVRQLRQVKAQKPRGTRDALTGQELDLELVVQGKEAEMQFIRQ